MMKLLCLLLLSLGFVNARKPKDNLFEEESRRKKPTLRCHITIECVASREISDNPRHHFECSPVENELVKDLSYQIELPIDFVQRHWQEVRAGNLFVDIPGGEIINNAVQVPMGSDIKVSAAPASFSVRRLQLAASGTKTVLVLRVSTNDASVVFSAQDLHANIFDDTKPFTQPSLRSQYNKLSFGKLNFVPSEYGVVDMYVNMNANGGSLTDIRDAAIVAMTTQNGARSITELADYVIVCIPPGTGDWAGSATVGGWRTVYNNDWCGYLSGLMHEMGHNLGLLHSNHNGDSSVDFTSYMSAGYAVPYYPSKSFNGANNWRLGWYSDRQTIIDPAQGGQTVALATFVDYGKSNKTNPVLIQVGNDTYLQYNRGKDFNYQAQQLIDQVTVVQQLSNGTNLLGGIGKSQPQLTITNFANSGRSLVLRVCSSGYGNDKDPDWVVVSIGYDASFCSQATATRPAPTLAPVQPTPAPVQPTLAPVQPTPAPVSPTFSPTLRPTADPTKPPTSQPTTTPVQPTMAPTPPPPPATNSCYDDSYATFLVDGINRTCIWLRGNGALQSQLCPQSQVQTACPRTCKACVSTCADHAGTFMAVRYMRNCLWLSQRRNAVVASFCAKPEVSSLCPITCKSCQ